MEKEINWDIVANALRINGYHNDMITDVIMQMQREIRWGDKVEDVLWSYGVTLAEAGLA